MGKVNSTTAIAKEKSRAAKPLVHRGIVILRPAVVPDTPLARIRRAARIAVKQHALDLTRAK